MYQIRLVPPLKTIEIRNVAQTLRDEFGIYDQPFPIVEAYEWMVAKDTFEFEILENDKMPHDYGLYIPHLNLIQIRQEIYDKAMKDDGFARSTMAHELGHWALKHGQDISFASSAKPQPSVTCTDPEWQAKKYSQELLIDTRLLSTHISPKAIEKRFKVTFQMAEVAYESLRREGLIK